MAQCTPHPRQGCPRQFVDLQPADHAAGGYRILWPDTVLTEDVCLNPDFMKIAASAAKSYLSFCKLRESYETVQKKRKRLTKLQGDISVQEQRVRELVSQVSSVKISNGMGLSLFIGTFTRTTSQTTPTMTFLCQGILLDICN